MSQSSAIAVRTLDPRPLPFLVEAPHARPWRQAAFAVWLVAVAAVFLLHAWHLSADFPNGSRWMDWSKYTDEGWYGQAAVDHYLRGSWNVPGDFNPGAALPVWPVMEAAVFHFTGVSLVAARGLVVAVFGGILLALYALMRRHAPRWVAALAVTLTVASSFLYAFSRLAILEPPLILFDLLALYAASRAGRRSAVALGLLLPLMVLTKTTAIFLFPAILFLYWYMERQVRGRRLGEFAGSLALVLGIAVALWGAYYFGVVRPHFLEDYRYLFSANPSPAQGPRALLGTMKKALKDGMWVDRVLYPWAGVLAVATLVAARRVWANPLFVAALLSLAGYFAFIVHHGSLQPRYYMVMAVPLFIVVSLAAAALLRQNARLGAVALGGCAVAVVLNLAEVAHFARTPQYTLLNTAQAVTRVIRADRRAKPLLLSISGSEITLVTGLPSICDDYGTLPLDERIARYRPGWYAAWNDLDAGALEDLHTRYRLRQVASFPALDDPDRNVLVLYKLLPRQRGKGDEITTEVDSD